MIRGLSRIVPNVVGGVCLAIGFLIVQPATAEEKAKAAAPADDPTGKLVDQRSAGEGYSAGR